MIALQTRAVMRMTALPRLRPVLASAIVAAFALALSTAARAAMITVDSLADTGAPGICVLRDAITAANTRTATNGCVAGTGSDTIDFSATGTITLGSTLPQVTDSLLTINGPALPGITLDGGGQVQVMTVAERAELNLKDLTIVNGSQGPGAGILNHGTLSITDGTFSHNGTTFPRTYHGGAIANFGTLTASHSTFSQNASSPGHPGVGGGIYNELQKQTKQLETQASQLQAQAKETQELAQRLETKDRQLAAQQREIDVLKQQNASINALSGRLVALERQARTANQGLPSLARK